MHIQEGTNTTLTTCTKMTEEVDRRLGVNGNGSSKGVNDEVPVQNSANSASGGRLKFFKDGKFILELVRGGERAGWVSVPRKTFWPPAAPPTATAHPPRPERAASLSVSDDNSSIQSSPWQRDHCWKQSTPRRNISKELTMYYCRPSTLLNSIIEAKSRLKRRRPYDPSHHDALLNGTRKTLTNGVCDKKRNGDVDHSESKSGKSQDCVDSPTEDCRSKPTVDDDRWTDKDREKYYHMKLKKPYQYHKLRVYKKTKPSIKRKLLNSTVDKLRERIASLPAPVNAKLVSCRQEHAMVSPRKRILRELERVSLEEQGCKRRAKTVPALSAAGPSPGPGPSQVRTPAPRHVSNYSIHSLLSLDEPRAPPPPRYLPLREPPAPYHAPGPAPAPHYAAPAAHYPAHFLLRAPPPHYYYPPAPWPPLPHALLTDLPLLHSDEPVSDLPLNLSKH